jgi:uncharacterized membrane protein YphA (DoxX/SURF4 family)
MNIVKIVIQVLLGLAFMLFGFMKLSTPYETMIATEGMMWASDFSPTLIKIIGGLELAGGIGTILPLLLKRMYVLVPLAALGFIGLMLGAAVTHFNRGENEAIATNVILIVLSLLVFSWRKHQLRFS